jgi:hypothetical protein
MVETATEMFSTALQFLSGTVNLLLWKMSILQVNELSLVDGGDGD